ncbi:MAG: dTMP kinase [Hyphomicrobium sp.]|jgi:dTMP kinase
MKRGKFITFEGGEGSGKSTQAARLAEKLRLLGHDVVLTREPGGSPFAERLRRLLLDPETEPHSPLAEALLFYAARADHLERVIRPALATGSWVLCDRFSDSTRVYQGHAGRLSLVLIDQLERIVVRPTVPDLTIMIDLDPVIGLDRAAQRRGRTAASATDAYEGRNLAFHSLLREGFLAIAHAEPQRCVVIDGSQSTEAVAAVILAAVEARLLVGAR